jgi:hypothetical protein
MSVFPNNRGAREPKQLLEKVSKRFAHSRKHPHKPCLQPAKSKGFCEFFTASFLPRVVVPTRGSATRTALHKRGFR